MGKQQRRKPPGNPPTRAEMFPIDLSSPYIKTNQNQRAREIRSHTRYNGPGSESSVLMGQRDNLAYPTLFPNTPSSRKRKDWMELGHDAAFKEAHRRGEIFQFETEEEAIKFAEGAWKDAPSKKKTALKRYGGPVSNLGMLSANPSLIMPQRGMSPASPAFPSAGFVASGVSGNHLRDKKGKYEFGGFTGTDTTAGIGGIAGMGAGLLAGIPTPEGKSGVGKAAASGALAGIGMGASFGPIGMAAGAVIGGLTGLFKRKKQHEAEQEQARLIAEQKKTTMKQNRYNQDAGSIGLFPTDGVQGVNTYYTALGGFPAAQYEAEDGEVITYANGGQVAGGEPTAFNGVLDQVSSNMSVIDGASHAQGGVDMAGGDFVFSKKLTRSKELASDLSRTMGYTPKDKSYAGIAESIGRKKGSLEEKLESNDPIALKTAEVMMERYDEALELVAFEQEFRKTKAA